MWACEFACALSRAGVGVDGCVCVCVGVLMPALLGMVTCHSHGFVLFCKGS